MLLRDQEWFTDTFGHIEDGQIAVLKAKVVPSLITMLESKVLSMQRVATRVISNFALVGE